MRVAVSKRSPEINLRGAIVCVAEFRVRHVSNHGVILRQAARATVRSPVRSKKHEYEFVAEEAFTRRDATGRRIDKEHADRVERPRNRESSYGILGNTRKISEH